MSNFEIMTAEKKFKIPGFRGVFWHDTLACRPKRNECGILNSRRRIYRKWTHWVRTWYRKKR